MNPNMKICRMLFPGGLDRALTLSYDDGVIQDRRLAELCRTHGVKCTFNLNSGTLGRVETATASGREPLDISCVTPEELQVVYAGHEIAGHGLWHSSLPDIGTPGAMYEVITDRVNLEKLSGRTVQSFAYPFGTFNEEVKTILRLAGYRSARTVTPTYGFAMPGDFLQWSPTCHHDDPRLTELTRSVFSGRRSFTSGGTPTNLMEITTGTSWNAFLTVLPRLRGRYGLPPTGKSSIIPRPTAGWCGRLTAARSRTGARCPSGSVSGAKTPLKSPPARPSGCRDRRLPFMPGAPIQNQP